MITKAPVIPAIFTAYKKSRISTHETVPEGFTREHSTANGVWALLYVLSGSLKFNIDEQGQHGAFEVTPDAPHVIVEEQPHHITIDGPVSFQLEFFRENS